MMDKNHDNSLNKNEFCSGIQRLKDLHKVSKDDLIVLFKLIDINGKK